MLFSSLYFPTFLNNISRLVMNRKKKVHNSFGAEEQIRNRNESSNESSRCTKPVNVAIARMVQNLFSHHNLSFCIIYPSQVKSSIFIDKVCLEKHTFGLVQPQGHYKLVKGDAL